MQQTPAPGQHILACGGETITFQLRVAGAAAGRAYLRTNIGHATTARRAIMREVLQRQPRLAEDWFDIPMRSANAQSSTAQIFSLTLPLFEPGHFEAKAFWVPEHGRAQRWPAGPNTTINVHPAHYAGANTLYNAFVRQFGQQDFQPTSAQQEVISLLDEHGYAVIPPSGTFRDLARELDFIVDQLRCRIILLLPIHPTPTVYGRMGRFGSPYAALDFMDVDPALAEFDPQATPLEQFGELVDGVHARGARLFLDIAINHTGWGAKIHSLYPAWLVREANGRLHSPGAWGVTWEDLTALDHTRHELWQYLAEVFLTWCRRGVDGFRCDAGYMIPVPAWEYIVATVRHQFPQTIFLLEGLGGKVETTRALLNIANMNWAYSELFQNYDRRQLEAYLPPSLHTSESDGLLMHFAETHDNQRLAAHSPDYARMRTALAALCATRGAFGFANGVEWLATQKIDVHQRTSLNWGHPHNQVAAISRLNSLLSVHPAFFGGAQMRLIQQGTGNSLALRRQSPDGAAALLILINLDHAHPGQVSWQTGDAPVPGQGWLDLLSEKTVSATVNGDWAQVNLKPAEVLCLSAAAEDLTRLQAAEQAHPHLPDLIRQQCLRERALEAVAFYRGMQDVSDLDLERLAEDLAADPRRFCQQLNPAGGNLVSWQWPRDLRRAVMLPPRHFLLISAPAPFRVQVIAAACVLRQEDALPLAAGGYFVLLPPLTTPAEPQACELQLTVYQGARAAHAVGQLLLLPDGARLTVPTALARAELLDKHQLILGTNGRGGMLRAGVIWGALRSRYDALLAGNLSRDFPEDRRIMLTRCRAWLVYGGYSQDITVDREQAFLRDGQAGLWRFRVPFGHGQLVWLDIRAEMIPGRNAVRLAFTRQRCPPAEECLADDQPVTLIIRPDIEDRNFHEDTKAYLGPEHKWPTALQAVERGFRFVPDPQRQLQMSASRGGFQIEPEWQYMIQHPLEAERGLQPASDLFSPGYFRASLAGGETLTLMATILTPQEDEALPATELSVRPPSGAPRPLLTVLEEAMRQFLVRRGALQTVIAGYPWFLDWGRDTLICVRGLIAAGLLDETRAILKQFASFEEKGTLPNMIHGDDTANRHTSDAPLWLIVACADWCRAAGHNDLLKERLARVALRRRLAAIIRGYQEGTPNGIRMDPDSGLIFSPSHFTWMDTNHPAGSPRAGYPIEIQALWQAALTFLAQACRQPRWRRLAEQVRASIRRYFWDPQRGYLADCLHAVPGQPAATATADDALRPNQLLALTLGAINEPEIGRALLSACEELLVPGAIRSLADRPVKYPLPIAQAGQLLNDPLDPYWGRYEGDEDTRRKPAYHNGTAWTWLFPSFAEAWVRVYGAAGRAAARAWLGSSLCLINAGCLGQIPEILDGDYPHRPRGCDAQAWGVTELYRVLKEIGSAAEEPL